MTTTTPAADAAGCDTETVAAGVWAALDRVVDPELDEPVTDLGFVCAVTVDENGTARVRLRLPTYFCAPNFAFLMVADAFDAARSAPGVRAVDVTLEDHFASAEINAGVRAEAGFAAAFAGLGEDDLDRLRLTFWRKAHLAEQERVASRLLAHGHELHDLRVLRLGDVAQLGPGPGRVEALRRHRRRLGLPDGDDAPLLVDDAGAPWGEEDLPVRLRFARTTRVSIEGNAGICRGLLATRYGSA